MFLLVAPTNDPSRPRSGMRAAHATSATCVPCTEDSLHGSRLSRVATYAVVERDPPVKRESNYAHGQRCPYVDTAVYLVGCFVSRRGQLVPRAGASPFRVPRRACAASRVLEARAPGFRLTTRARR